MTVKDALKMADVAIDALSMIRGLTKVGGDKTASALAAVGAIVDTLQDGLAGKTSPEIIAAELDALIRRIADNDAAADAALDARFPGSQR